MAAETTHLDAFRPLVRPHALTAPVPMVDYCVRRAAIEFCERTRCWRELITATVDEANEVIVAPAYAAIHRIENATFLDGDIPLEPRQFTDISRFDRSQQGVPRYIIQTNPNTISLIHHATGDVELSVLLKPVEGQEVVLNAGVPRDQYDVAPKFLLTQYGEAIAAGALARLFIMPKQEWTDNQLAAYYAQRFENACAANFNADIVTQTNPPARSRMYEL